MNASKSTGHLEGDIAFNMQDHISLEELQEQKELELATLAAMRRAIARFMADSRKGCGQPAHLKFRRAPGQGMLGLVKNGLFHVYDSINGSFSYSEITGAAPRYKPIPLDFIVSASHLGHELRYLDDEIQEYGLPESQRVLFRDADESS